MKKTILWTILALLLPVTQAWGDSHYYAQLKAQVATAWSGCGTVYAGTSTSVGDFADSSTSDSLDSKNSAGGEETFYAFAKPAANYEFDRWEASGATVTATEDYDTDGSRATVTVAASKTADATATGTVTAYFKKKVLPAFSITFKTSASGVYTVDGAAPVDKTGLTGATKVTLASSDPNFLDWIINGTIVNGNPYTASFGTDTTISAEFLTADQVAEVTTFADLTSALANDGKKKVVIPSGTELVVAKGAMLTVPAGKQLVVNGSLAVVGTLTNNGVISGNGAIRKISWLVSQSEVIEPSNTYRSYTSFTMYSSSFSAKYCKTTTTANTPSVTGVSGFAEKWGVLLNGTKVYEISKQNPKALSVSFDTSKAVNYISSINGNIDAISGYPVVYLVLLADLTDTYKHDGYKGIGQSGTIDCAGKKYTASGQIDNHFHPVLLNGSAVIGSGSYTQNANAAFINCMSINVNKCKGTCNMYFFDCGTSSSLASVAISNYDSAATWNTYFYSGYYNYTFDKSVHVYGGTFSKDPTSYLQNNATENGLEVDTSVSDRYTVRDKKPAEYKLHSASDASVKYETLQQAVAAVAANGSETFVLDGGLEISGTVTIPEGKHITIDLGGFNISGGTIENSGVLRLEDNSNQEVKGLFTTPVVNKKGTIDITYGQYGSTFTLEGGTLTTHGGTFTSTFSYEECGGTANLRGGTYNCTITVPAGHELVGSVLSETSRGVVICDNPLSAADISYTVRGLDPVDRGLGISDFDLYSNYKHLKTGWTTRSDFAGREALWDRLAELRSTVEPVESKAIEATMAFDRFVKAGSVSGVASLAGQTRSLALEDDVDANDDYHVFIPMVTGAGYYAISYKNMFNGEENDRWAKLQCGLKNNSSDNIGTVLTFKYQLRTQERAPGYTPQNPVYIETFTTYGIGRYMLGGKKAAIDRESRRVAYDSLVAAVADAQSGERILIGADTADNVTLAKAGTYTIDPYGFNFTGTVKVADGYTMNTSTAPSAADAQGVQSALATTYVVVDASVVEVTGGTKKYPSVAAAIAGETGNEIALTVTANVTETVAVPAGKKVTITVAEGVESKLTVNPAEGAFLVEAKNGATTSYEAKRITEKPVSPTSGVSAKEVSGGNTNDVADASALVTRLMGNAAIERVDNTTVAALDEVEVTPMTIIDVKSGDQGVIEAATFDVVPKANEGQSLGETMIKFRLSVEAATDKIAADVFHAGEFFGVLPVASETVGETTYKFIEVESNAFSPYGYELADYVVLPENQTIADWPDATPVKYGDTFYATLQKAVEAAYDAGDKNIFIYCKPGANVGKMSHAHVVSDITVYGNGASVAVGGDADFEVDTYKGKGGPAGSELTGDITLNIDHLNGCAVWGQRNSDYKIAVNMTGCRNVNRIYFSTAKGTIDINVDECSFVKANGSSANTSIKTDSQGTWKIKNSTFNDIAVAIAATNENGPAEVTIENCTFIDCATTVNAAVNSASDYASPIRVLGRAETNLKIDGCSFSYSEGAERNSSDVVVGELRGNKAATSVVSYKIVDTVGIVDVIETHEANVTIADISTVTTITEETKSTPIEGDNEAVVAQIGDVKYATLAEAVAAANAEDVIEIIKADTYTIPNLPKNVTITGAVDGVVFNCVGTGSIASVPNGATLGNVTMNFGAAGYHGFQHAGEMTFNGCTLNGLLISYGDMNFNGCTFNAPGTEASGVEGKDYSMWAYGKDLAFTDCTFNCAGKCINVYCENNSEAYDVSFDGCEFNSTYKNKAAINIKETCGANVLKYNVSVTDCTANGENFPAASEDATGALYVISPLVQVDDRNLADDFESSIKVELAEEEVYPVAKPVAQIGDVKYATLAAALDAAQAGDTVTLLKDIEGVTNAFEITKAITLDGNGHKIVAAANENPRDMIAAYLGARVMFQVRAADGVTFRNLTVDGGETHYYTFLAETKGGVFTVENTQWLHGGEASVGDVAGVGYGAAIHVNGGILLANGSFLSCTGGKEAGVFPFTGILYDDGGIHFDDEATATIGDDLLLVGMTGAPDVSTEEGKAYVEELLAAMNVPVGFAPYTLKLGDDSSLAFTGASLLGWNGIIDYGKQIMDVAGEIGYEGMDKEKTPVEVGLLTDTVLPEVFSFGDTNLTVNGNGNALSGEITYTDNAGFIEDIKLGAENPLVLDMTEVTKPVLLGSGIVVSNLIIKMTPEQAVVGTPVVTWSTDDGAVAPAVHAEVKVHLVEEGTPTGETKDLIWDAEMGLAYIGPVEARLTGPTHEKPVYTSFAEAIAQAAESGDTVTLMTNLVDYVGTQGINKSLTLDGAGHKIVAKPVTIHRDIFSSYVQSTSMLKLQSGEITIKNLTLDGDASHAYTYLVSADNSNVSLTTENVNLFHGGELMGDETGAVKAAGAGYGAAVHLNNGATMVVKDGFIACTGGKDEGVFPFTGILVDSNGANVTFDLTDDSDTNPTVGIGSDLLLVGMPEAIDAETAQGILDEMKVPTRFIPYTLTLDDGSAYAFTGASPLGWNAIIDYGKEIMDVAGEMGYEGLDKETTPIEVGLLTDTVLPEVFTFGDTNLTVNGNGNALSGEITYTDNAGLIENIELGVDGKPLVIDLTGSTRPVKMGEEITVTDLIIKMTPEQAKSGKTVIAWSEGDKPENPEKVIVAVVDPETSEPTGTKTLVWDEELCIAYIGPVEARLTGSNHEPVYTTLAEAMAQAESGDTVKMLSDVAQTNAIDVTTAVTLDLNGKAITAAIGWKSEDPGNKDAMFAVVRGASLTVDDTTSDKLGKIDCSTSGADKPYVAIKLTKTGEPANGAVAAVTVNGGSVIGNYYGICGNGSRHDTAVTVNGGLVKGTIENDCAGIFNPQNGALTVTGGTVEGATAIYAKSGTIEISGGTITATGAAADYAPNGSGMKSTGDALVIDNCGNPGGTPIVSVTGGAFSSANNKVIGSYGYGESAPLEKFVSGGIYNKPVDQACIVEGKFSVDNTDAATKSAYPYAVGIEEPFAPLKVTFRDAVGEKPAEKVPFIVSEAWVEENFHDFVGTAEELKQAIEATLDETKANGLRGWQNYQLGFDGSETANPLSPDATAADDQVNVIVKSFRPVTFPKHDTGVVAQFVLRQGSPTRDAAGEITGWTWADVQTQNTPEFSVAISSLEVETYWRIKVVFSQATAK